MNDYSSDYITLSFFRELFQVSSNEALKMVVADCLYRMHRAEKAVECYEKVLGINGNESDKLQEDQKA